MATKGVLAELGRMAGRLTGDAPSRGHVLIAGTGRAGTTLLVRIFTHLGLDTGFTRQDIEAAEANVGRAGLEKKISRKGAARLPEIVKRPQVVDELGDGIAAGWFKVDHAIIPLRELRAAAESRRAVRDRAIRTGIDPKQAPGGLWKTDDPENQVNVLAVQFYKIVEMLVSHDVPVTFISFPRFAEDAEYFVSVLGSFLSARYGLSPDALRAAHAAEARRDFIGGRG